MPAVYAGSEAWPHEAAAVAVGNFDGVHAGHRAVLDVLRERAAHVGAVPTVYTFDPAPTVVLAPERHQPRILTLGDRIQRLGEAGIDAVVVEPFTRAFADQPAEWFAEEVLARRMNARVVVIGHDFRFGARRAGNVEALRRWLPHVEIVLVEAHTEGDQVVSSSRIRRLVAAGEVEAATLLLGRPHALHGRVVMGDQRGRLLGFPTANLENEVELTPADGVYAVRASIDGGEPWPGVMNIGQRPTFAGRERRTEVHLLPPEDPGDGRLAALIGDGLYGRNLRAELIARLRGERRFEGVDALRTQIAVDADAAREKLRETLREGQA